MCRYDLQMRKVLLAFLWRGFMFKVMTDSVKQSIRRHKVVIAQMFREMHLQVLREGPFCSC